MGITLQKILLSIDRFSLRQRSFLLFANYLSSFASASLGRGLLLEPPFLTDSGGITALASATVVFNHSHSLHFGEVTTIDQLFVSEKCNTIK